MKNPLVWYGILSVFVSAGLFYVAFFSPAFAVKAIKVEGFSEGITGEIQNITKNNSVKNIFFLKTENIFLADLNKAEKEVKEAIPQISEFKIKRKFFNTIDISGKERNSIVIWCNRAEDQERCYFADKEGIVYQENAAAEGMIRIIDDTRLGIVLLGVQVIDKDALNRIFNVKDKLRALGVDVAEFHIANDRFIARSADGWLMYLDLLGDLEWQMTKLSAVLQEKIPPEKRKDLEYIELRFGNLAPYKYLAN